MSDNVIRFSHPEQEREAMREEAAIWLTRLERGASAEEYTAIEQWLSEDPTHGEVFLELAAFWDKMAVLSELSEVFPLAQYAAVSPRGMKRQRQWPAPAIAFSCLVFMILLGGTGFLGYEAWNGFWYAASQQYETAVGEQRTVELADGSEVMLNTNSLMEVSFTEDERKVVLEKGEALYTVTRDTNRPFRVYAGNRVIEAVGTSFTVLRTPEDGLEVMVTEGAVKLRKVAQVTSRRLEPDDAALSLPELADDERAAGGDEIPVIAGELAAIPDIQGDRIEKLEVQPTDMEAKLAWRHGMLLFQGEPLAEVIEEMGRYTSVKIEVDPAIENLQVVGYFKVGDLDGLLFAMQENFQVKARMVGNRYILSPQQ